MLPTPKKYTVLPRVFEVGVESEIFILAEARTFLFPENTPYTVMISGVNGDDPWYHDPSAWVRYDLVAEGGILRFTHIFDKEQEYQIRVYRGDPENSDVLVDLAVYALEKDLYVLRPLRGDLHTHSYRSDGECDPAELLGYFREMGYDFQALTDHNRHYPNYEVEKVFEGVKLGICPVMGEEVHTPTSTVHIVHVGGKQSVTDIYMKDTPRYEEELSACRARVPDTIPENHRERYAQALWSTERIHRAGGLAIFPHPFWRPGHNHCYNVCDTLTRTFLTSGMFDAFELVGGMGVHGINRALALWQELRAEGQDIHVVGSSDVHKLNKADFPYHFTVLFATENTTDAIVAAVKAGMSVAAEMSGKEYEREFRAYGSLRLVSYTQFLFLHYFSDLQRICQGEGVAMREYAMGRTPRETLEAQVRQTADFTDRFFGRTPPVLPDRQMLDLEDQWREIHVAGPASKGSLAFPPWVTRQL